MKNTEFVAMIQNIGDINSMPDTINAREIFLTLINGFLYIKPGENTIKFYQEFRRCLAEGRAAGEVMYVRRGKHIPFNKCVRTRTALALMNCIKESFDKEYFASMLDKIDVSVVGSTKKNLSRKLGFKQHQELFELLYSFGSFDRAINLHFGVTSNDEFARLMAKIICYTDVNTAYLYANMLLDLDRALNMNVFNQGNLEVTTGLNRMVG